MRGTRDSSSHPWSTLESQVPDSVQGHSIGTAHLDIARLPDMTRLDTVVKVGAYLVEWTLSFGDIPREVGDG